MKSKGIDPKRIEAICQFLDNPNNRLMKLSEQNFTDVVNPNSELFAKIMNEVRDSEPEAKVNSSKKSSKKKSR